MALSLASTAHLHCERLFKPPRVSNEGATGESGLLIFYSSRAMLEEFAEASHDEIGGADGFNPALRSSVSDGNGLVSKSAHCKDERMSGHSTVKQR